MSLLEEAREALGSSISPLTAQLLVRLATELYFIPGTWDRRDLLSAAAVAVARRLGDPPKLAVAGHVRNFAMWAPGNAAERLVTVGDVLVLPAESRYCA